MKKQFEFIITFSLIFIILNISSSAHQGKTDHKGGHYVSGTNKYHYHHGYPAHNHTTGVCPYSTKKTTYTESTATYYDDTYIYEYGEEYDDGYYDGYDDGGYDGYDDGYEEGYNDGKSGYSRPIDIVTSPDIDLEDIEPCTTKYKDGYSEGYGSGYHHAFVDGYNEGYGDGCESLEDEYYEYSITQEFEEDSAPVPDGPLPKLFLSISAITVITIFIKSCIKKFKNKN